MKTIKHVVCMIAAVSVGTLLAGENTWQGPANGHWDVPTSWSLGHVPGASDDAVIGTGAKVVATNSIAVQSLTLNGAQLTFGGGEFQARPKISVAVSGNVTLTGASKLYAYAAEIDYDSFVDQATAIAAMRTGAMKIQIGGNFTVGDTSVVSPECAELTGTPVFFWVGGDFSLAQGAKFDVIQRGWGWKQDPWTDHPKYAKPCRTEGVWKDFGWTFAFAPGHSRYNNGTSGSNCSNYGHAQAGMTDSRDGVSYSYGANYGTTFAPFLPGSPCGGHYMLDNLNEARKYRGSGSIVVLAQGNAQIDGQMTADGIQYSSEGSSGGGILLAADSFAFGPAAALSAQGGNGTGYFPPGCGGRIALLVGFDEGGLETVLDGTLPSGSAEWPTIEGVAVSVRGGEKSGSFAGSGTCSRVLSSTKQATLTTRSNVAGLSATGVVWGDEILVNGTYSRTAPQHAVLIENPTIEYTCQGYVLSNKTEQVSAAADRTAAFAIDGRDGPYALTWLWGDPHEKEPDPVARRWVGPNGGSLTDAANWVPSGVPTSVDELYVTNATLTVDTLKVGKLVFSGGRLTFGSAETRQDFAFDVKGDVVLCGKAQVSVYAPRKSDLAQYTSVAVARKLLWANRTSLKVGGTLSVSGGTTVKIANEPETGDLVVFEVGAFDLAADGTVDADGNGFTWFKKDGATLPSGTIRVESKANIGECYTYGFGTVHDNGYSKGANHSYGLDFAPYEPGSCGDAYSGASISRGGGSIVIHAKGAVTLAGTLTADAVLSGSYSGPSGGSIWVAGATLERQYGLVVRARGMSNANGNYGGGMGGRVALMSDVTTEEQIAALVGGTRMEGHAYEALSFDGLHVESVIPSTGALKGSVGSAVSAYDASNYESVKETAVPLEATSSLARYGSSAVRCGQTVTRSITEIGGDVKDPSNVRYFCTGYVVSNATEEVAAGSTRELSFTVAKGAGPYKVTWLWGVRETRSQVLVTGPGAVTVNGEDVSEAWVTDDSDVTFVATPEAGKSFWTWVGSDVLRAQAAQTTLAIPADKPHVVRAVFCDETADAKARSCTSTAKGDFYDPANWPGGVVPNPQDRLALTAGDLKASRRFACSALTLSGKAKLAVEDTDVVAIAGDVRLSNSAVWTVTAQPTNTATAFADGATRVNIAGDFVVADTASVKPVCDSLTGGTVVFNVKSLSIAAGASVNADEAGWGWVDYTGEPAAGATTYGYSEKGYDIHRQTLAIGRGDGYGNGGSHAQKGNAKSGPAYGFANAPIQPGSPNGCYTQYDPHRGGGLIRIHVRETATVNGTLTADACLKNTFGGPSGGGIWLTAKAFSFGEGAVLRARGGNSNYSWSYGSGGRIAVGRCLTDDEIAGLAATGAFVPKRRVKDAAAFRAEVGNATMTVDVRPNSSDAGLLASLTGTFVYIDGKRGGLMMIVR